MTSSLVGSEMCIRDRCTRFTDLFGNVGDGTPEEHGIMDKQAAPTDPTVSYTHLTLPTICSV
eukprot:657214-Prorocentrum_lima.AAC.1